MAKSFVTLTSIEADGEGKGEVSNVVKTGNHSRFGGVQLKAPLNGGYDHVHQPVDYHPYCEPEKEVITATLPEMSL